LRSAEEAGIPVVTWDSDLLAKDKARRKTYIGTENYKLGVELGKLLLEFKPQGGSLALLSGGTAAENLNQRMQGIRDTIQGRGFTEVAGTPLYCNDDSALAIQQLEDILGRHPELDAFISVGAWPLSVQRAYRLVAQKYQQRIEVGQLVVLSADTLPMQLQIVKDRLAHALVGQRPFQMGYRVVFALSEIIDGKSVQDPEYTGLDICRQQTVDSCVVR
jgi:ribose transport system substrate-binding protein